MRRRFLVCVVASFLILVTVLPTPAIASPDLFNRPSVRAADAFSSASVMFAENVGQFAKDVRYRMHGARYNLWLADDALWIMGKSNPLRISFPGSNPHPKLEAFDHLDTVVSYFIGNDPAKWKVNVPVWRGVRYADLYPNVDLEVSEKGGHWTWRLVVHEPLFDLSDVRMRVEGADELTLEDGYLSIDGSFGELGLPLLQVVDANGVLVDTSATQPRTSGALVIAPVSSQPDHPGELLYSTFLGGGDDEGVRCYECDIAVDPRGNAYVTGRTWSSDFPATDEAFDQSYDGDDVFVAKISSDGSRLIYSTFLGGKDIDIGNGIAVDEMGRAYVIGHTSSPDFPTTSYAFDRELDRGGGGDVFVAKVNATGTNLVYATLLGGHSAGDVGVAIAVDWNGNAYITGETNDSTADFPTTSGAFSTSHNGAADVFVAKLDSDGSELIYSTFLGGAGYDSVFAIAVDRLGNAYVAGYSGGAGFPTTPGAFDRINDGSAFVAKVRADGAGLAYATFIGGTRGAEIRAIAVDGAGNAYVTGNTGSPDFPLTEEAFDASFSGDSEAFVAKVNADGTDLDYASFLGGSGNDRGRAIFVDKAGNAYVAGETFSPDFAVTPGAFDTTFNGKSDGFLAHVNPGGTQLTYATFLGGSEEDDVGAIDIDWAGNVYVMGRTSSDDFPTTAGVFETDLSGGCDLFVAKLQPKVSVPKLELVGQIGGAIRAVSIQGSYAYVGLGPRVAVLDITTPASPVMVGRSRLFPGMTRSIVAVGRYAYVITSAPVGTGSSLHVIDISKPSTPKEVGFYDMPDYAEEIAVVDNYVYVAASDLHIVDVSSPSKPIEIGMYNVHTYINNLKVTEKICLHFYAIWSVHTGCFHTFHANGGRIVRS